MFRGMIRERFQSNEWYDEQESRGYGSLVSVEFRKKIYKVPTTVREAERSPAPSAIESMFKEVKKDVTSEVIILNYEEDVKRYSTALKGWELFLTQYRKNIPTILGK